VRLAVRAPAAWLPALAPDRDQRPAQQPGKPLALPIAHARMLSRHPPYLSL
jgi:hypothetical protein